MDTTEQEEEKEIVHGEKGKKSHAKKKTITIGVIAILLIIIGCAIGWLYTGSVIPAKEKVFNYLPLPAAIVDMNFVSANKVISRINLQKQLADAQGLGVEVNATDTFDQLLESKKIEALANKYRLKVEKAELDEEYNNIVKQYANGDENSFKVELEKTYAMTPDEFKNDVIRQELLQSQLVLWYNSQEDLNKDAYAKVKALQDKLANGQSIEDIIKAYSEDENLKDFAGDSGMISFDDLLPEFRKSLQDAKKDEIKFVVSRYGLHILKVLDTNNDGENGDKQIHLKQVYQKTEGFQKWLLEQSDNVRVIKLLKF